MKNIKKRNWCFILYLDSAPKDWKDILQQTGLQFAISPYHDKDLNSDGTEKKPHYHIIMSYDGPTSFNVVRRVTESVNATIPQPLEQIRGYYRYFTHKDNPDKFQYSETDITSINGFNINDYVELTYSEVSKYVLQIQYIIRDKHILDYAELLDYLADNDCKELWDIAKNKPYLFNIYIWSRKSKTIKEHMQENK